MATKKPSILEYITFGTTAYSVGSALIPLMRAKKINRTKVLSQVLVLINQVNSAFNLKISEETAEKCLDAVLAVLAEGKKK